MSAYGALFALWMLTLVALFGRARLARMEREIRPDWRVLADFGAALEHFTRSAGHDARALASMNALAPAAFALLEAGSPPRPASRPSAAPPAERAGLDELRRAFDDGGADPRATAERARLSDLHARVLQADGLLQAEMRSLSRQGANFASWLERGAAGLLLLLLGRLTGGTPSARARRRALESDARFVATARLALMLLIALAFLLGERALSGLLHDAG